MRHAIDIKLNFMSSFLQKKHKELNERSYLCRDSYREGASQARNEKYGEIHVDRCWLRLHFSVRQSLLQKFTNEMFLWIYSVVKQKETIAC